MTAILSFHTFADQLKTININTLRNNEIKVLSLFDPLILCHYQ
ncbi:hypothetical protein KL86DYS2_12555 [uncultured Dysgonomonas sp.]|uniref:Uncharacterized protein n=1 Tax=uncultured Dysgonomonas sp. TaxID=206096 RepID=A0A212JXD6_9BACT|nr:hypothetical protein KL86DYS2_12555 [uncultured Dysgonomonas sp.]